MAWASVIGGVASAAGGLLGAKKSKTKGAKLKKIKMNDPTLNALSVETMMALGLPISQEFLERASPLGNLSNYKIGRKLINLVNAGQESGLSLDEIMQSIESGVIPDDVAGVLGQGASRLNQKKLGKLLAKSGFSSLRDLVQADIDFSTAAGERSDRINAIQPGIEQGRLDALSKIAGLQSGFISPTEEQLNTKTSEIEGILRAQIARDFGDQQQQALYQANSMGINPAARLGRLDEGQALANLAAGPDALARTLQLLSGQQGLQTNAIGALQGSLQPGITNASNLLGMRMNQNSAAANQALGLAQLQSTNNQLLGQGIQNAANNLGTIPMLIQEQRRQQEIDKYYGIGSPTPQDG
jgi:hypothetical protein